MPLAESLRSLYDHEIDSNHKMLAMLDSVPEASRSDHRFQQAVSLGAHLAACRENWLDCILTGGQNMVPWSEPDSNLATLRPRFAALEKSWTDYLAALEEPQLARDFEFDENGGRFAIKTEVQLLQLVGHAPYHRGQIALLVDQLGGHTVDTDYVYWVLGE